MEDQLRPLGDVLSIEDLNAWVYPACLRRYQGLILNQQDFDLIVDDQHYRWLTCTTIPSVNLLVLERCSDGGCFLLRSDGCGTGFSLEHSRLEPCPADLNVNYSGSPVLCLGDPNFAHFLWNELDPLLRLLQQSDGLPLEVVQHSDSILDVATLEGVRRLPLETLATRPSVHAGGMRVTAAARAVALHSLCAPPQACPRVDHPLLVLGVRGPGRRELENEVELLCALVQRLRGLCPDLHFALDGFTYQRNNLNDPGSRLREQQVGERIDRVLAICGQDTITSLHGLGFGDYLQQVAGAWCYVTHEGTIQHKIGWMYPSIPGVCLAAGPHVQAIADWHRLQCEGAGSFESLPVGLLVHADVPEDPSDRNQSFIARDLPATVEAIVQRILPHLQHPTSVDASPFVQEAADQAVTKGQVPAVVENAAAPCVDPANESVSALIWQSDDPHAALSDLARRRLEFWDERAMSDPAAVFEFCELACFLRRADLLALAAQSLARLEPSESVWVPMHSLRLRWAGGESDDDLRQAARHLAARSSGLDRNSRQMLAGLLAPEAPPPELLPEMAARHCSTLIEALTQPPPHDTSAICALLSDLCQVDPELSASAASVYARLGPSLRRPWLGWEVTELTEPGLIDGLVGALSSSLANGHGFSLIRLGDGDGMLMAGERPDLEGATLNGERVAPHLRARAGRLPTQERQAIDQRFREAVLGADVIGLPDLWQCVHGPEQTVRAAAGLGAILRSSELVERAPRLLPGGWLLNLQLLAFGSFHRPPFDQVSAVIGPALPRALRGSAVTFLQVPGESAHWPVVRDGPAHYPEVFHRVLETIGTCIGPGDLVLIGAGLLGKIYAHAVRTRGGVAVDIGSVIDLSCGRSGSRGEHRLNPWLVETARSAFQPAIERA